MISLQLPEWAQQEEKYQPDRDRDYFISRSLLRILSVLGALREQGSKRTRLPALPMLLLLLAFILLTVATQNSFILLLLFAVSLLLIALQPAQVIRHVLSAGLLAALFCLFLILPALLLKGGGRVLLLPVKTFLTMSAVALFSQSFSWHAVLHVLARLHVPQTVIFLFDTTLRSIMLLAEQAEEMLVALKLRSVGHNKRKSKATAGILGALFLRSKRISEETYEAMVCRGFTGEYEVNKNDKA